MLQFDMYFLYGFAKSLRSLAKYLVSKNIEFAVYDDNPKTLAEARAIGYTTCSPETLNNRFELVISPGIPLTNYLVLRAKENRIKIWNDISLFFNVTSRTDHIGFTGSFGKSTSVALFHHIYNRLSEDKIQIGGNIGIPVFDLDLHKPAVIELSAQQLALCHNLPLSIAVLLNLYPQHLDWYHDITSYYKTKLRIFDNAKLNICRAEDLNAIIKFRPDFTEKQIRTIEPIDTELPHVSTASFAGAYTALIHCGFSSDAILDAASSFTGLPHRGEVLQSQNLSENQYFINDSKSTNLLNSVYIINKYTANKNKFGKIGCILGGKKTPQNLEILSEISGKVDFFCVTGSSAPELYQFLINSNGNVELCGTLQECIDKCVSNNCKTIIFTPGYPSTDQYRDFEHRGEVFKKIVSGEW